MDSIAGAVDYNVHKAMNWTRRAFIDGADYVFLQEGLTADYTPEPLQTGRSVDGSEVHGFCHLAKQHNGYVALGLNEVFQGRPYISMVWLVSCRRDPSTLWRRAIRAHSVALTLGVH